MKRHMIAMALAIGAPGASASAQALGNNLVEQGRQVFQAHCDACHGPGIGNPGAAYRTGTDALRVKYHGTLPALLAERRDLTPEMVSYFVRNGVSVMAPYRKTEISGPQLAALGAYLSRNNPGVQTAKGMRRGKR